MMGSEKLGTVLVVEDDAAIRRAFERMMRANGIEVRTAGSAEEAEMRLRSETFRVLITDLNLGGGSGLELMRLAADIRPGMPTIVITGAGHMEDVVSAMRLGAFDFITKPFNWSTVFRAVSDAIESARRDEERPLSRGDRDGRRFPEIVGASPSMERLRVLLEPACLSNVTVLITGESGTGKEVVAQALHHSGPRAEGPFVAINCAAIPDALIESELFGHTRGAFTDSKASREGLLVRAKGGTVFLDEVGELSAKVQAKLLRALQTKQVRPVGSDHEVPIDARIVAATNRDLSASIEDGRFRDDLYFRLAVLELEVPPLRERGQDVMLLAEHWLREAAESAGKTAPALSRECRDLLLAYEWPGNVRELRNCMERVIALSRGDEVASKDLPKRIRDGARRKTKEVHGVPERYAPLEEVQRSHVLGVLDAVDGHRGRACKILGLNRKTLYRKLAAWSTGASELPGMPS